MWYAIGLILLLGLPVLRADSPMLRPPILDEQRKFSIQQRDSVLIENLRRSQLCKAASSPSDTKSEISFDYSGSGFRAGANDIAVSGDYAYYVSVDGLVVLDINNLSAPVRIARLPLPSSSVARIVISGKYAYITGPDLTVVDIETPAAPIFVGNYSLAQFATDVLIVDTLAYVLESSSLEILNISQPQSPTLLGSCALQDYPVGVRVHDGIACVVYRPFFTPGGGMQIVDVSNPNLPVVKGSCSISPYVDQLAIEGSFAYAATLDSGLQIVAIADPEAPYLVGSYFADSLSGVSEVVISDTLLFATNWRGLWVIDVSNAQAPHVITRFSSYPWLWNPYNFSKSGEHLIVINFGSISIVDVSEPTTPYVEGHYATGTVQNVCLEGSYAYIADGYRGLIIVDVSNPADLVEIGSYLAGTPVNAVAVRNGIAYLVGFDLQVVDVSNPASPALLASYNNLLYSTNIAVVDTMLYVMDVQGLTIFNLVNPGLPQFEGKYAHNYYAGAVDQAFAIRDTLAFLALGDSGVQIINIADFSAPVLVNSYTSPRASGVDVVDSLMYIADEDSGLVIVNVADPMNPELLGVYHTFLCRNVRVSGDYAYLGSSGFEAVNIVDPLFPYQAGIYYTSGLVLGSVISGQYAYIADWYEFLVLHMTRSLCGDANGSSTVSISDVVFLINYLFASGAPPSPLSVGDANCSGAISITDAVYLIHYLFAGGAAPCAACP